MNALKNKMNHIESLIKKSWSSNRPLTILGIAMIGTLIVSFIGILVDPRSITGQPAWMKPMKFSVSISIYSFTLLWMLTFIKNRPIVVRTISWITLVSFVIEMIAIIGQVLRNTTSHFNRATPFDEMIFIWMGNAVVAIWMCCLITGIYLIFQKLDDRAFAWSLRTGVLLSFVGMGVAFLMTVPTPTQLEQSELTGEIPISGAHSVGVEDGGAGLPIVGWSTEGGDLRIGHFVGLHGMQILPLLGLLFSSSAFVNRMRPVGRLLLVLIASASYLGLTLLLTWQALRGQSIIAPDATTLIAFVILLLATTVAASITWFMYRETRGTANVLQPAI